MNELTIHYGDNLVALQAMPDACVSLVYIDPPFNTGKIQKRTQIATTRDENGDRTGFQGKRYRTITIGTKSYHDVFDDYLSFIEPRLIEAHRILKQNGSLFFHIDYREAHYCKLLLDRIFGRDCFMNEIIWAYDYGARSKKRWSPKHDTIFWYAKTADDYIFNFDKMDRIPYMAPGLVGAEKAARGKTPTDVWWHTPTDIWWHTIVSPNGKEKTGYPTQKPRAVIDRILRVHSNPGDTVCDFFAGSGTLGESAVVSRRNCILIDNNQEALRVMEERFRKLSVDVRWHGWTPQDTTKEIKPTEVSYTKVPDPEFKILADISQTLKTEYPSKGFESQESPFAWFKHYSSGRKGAIAKKLVIKWLEAHELVVQRTKRGSGADYTVAGKRVTIKSSMLWANGGYKFQQLRDQNYDLVICLGLSPFNAHCWVIPKTDILRLQMKGKIKGQHLGESGVDTAWLDVLGYALPEWLTPFGGSLSDGIAVLSRITGFEVKRTPDEPGE